MAIRLGLVVLLLALAAVVAEPKLLGESDWGLAHFSGAVGSSGDGGLVGDLVDPEEEMMMDSETGRRVLAQQRRYISYSAMNKNKVPCSRRGKSYYNCNQSRGTANPYNRGCSTITHCARRLD